MKTSEIVRVLFKQSDRISKLIKCLTTIYLNHPDDGTVHNTSLRNLIESLAEDDKELGEMLDIYK